MIERLLIKNHLSFDEVELNFKEGLSVFTGVSGAGKSVLMNAIMSAFGLSESEARLVELDVRFNFNMSEFGIENEDVNSFKMLKDKSTRYFINSQAISKKNLSQIANEHIKHLCAKQINEFENERFLELLDALVQTDEHRQNLKKIAQVYENFKKVKTELDTIKSDELKIEELKEFAKFEIEKISSVNPKKGEFDELMAIKKRLSKRDKIEQAWARAEQIYEFEHSVVEALNISELDTAFFEEAMNSLRIAKDSLNMDELDDFDAGVVLDRIEALNGIIRRYGSEEEALNTLERKKEELQRYENLSFSKQELEAQFIEISKLQTEISDKISSARKAVINRLETLINSYLNELYMKPVSLLIEPKNVDESGADFVTLNLNNTALNKLSSGELNRLRLAFIASSSDILQSGNGVIILDEIDANLSGKEAMSIANVLVKIAKFYQIFAISHQPQLSSKANSHFLVEKNAEKSSVRELKPHERADELARMISGEHISREALEFAKGLLSN
ncbi:AAA family ATPase [Campylobacter mucosalis]|uniref:AAA family ATPase n=1 Tax=Campylobacter mucosalis TaxID=202 RepID=UPI00147044C2|nr:AAA family ATPase [Campylobacter mucosalis]